MNNYFASHHEVVYQLTTRDWNRRGRYQHLIGAQLSIVFMESLITKSLICVTVQVKHPSYYE